MAAHWKEDTSYAVMCAGCGEWVDVGEQRISIANAVTGIIEYTHRLFECLDMFFVYEDSLQEIEDVAFEDKH